MHNILRAVMQNVQRYEIKRREQREWNKGTEMERDWEKGETKE